MRRRMQSPSEHQMINWIWQSPAQSLQALAAGKKCVLGLATGSTPMQIYRKLVKAYQKGLSFRHVVTFNLDEYYPMEPDALQSYHLFMQEHLFKHIDILPENIHIPDGAVSAAEVAGYEAVTS